ncbi:Conserved_hypothetical protein [Hexamita inflata]|uniref:Transmembrane protein n=1 Tax=Hexamita inflata TaxID=28002 RepID=A0AA86QQ19_9EUKA|nr:Conserved hypothetical protein [Hexamita inflata]
MDLQKVINQSLILCEQIQTQELLPNIRQYLTSPTIIIFALIPIAAALFSILLCCPTSLIVTRCNSYTRYHLKHKKIQKTAQIILEQESVSRHGIPVEILINSSKVAKADRRTMFKLSKDIYKNKQKAFKRAKCAKLCWYSWFFTIIVYFVSLILLCVGINHITHLPQDAVNKISEQIGNVKQVIDSGAVSIDKVISQFTTSNQGFKFARILSWLPDWQFILNSGKLFLDSGKLPDFQYFSVTTGQILQFFKKI